MKEMIFIYKKTQNTKFLKVHTTVIQSHYVSLLKKKKGRHTYFACKQCNAVCLFIFILIFYCCLLRNRNNYFEERYKNNSD